MGKKLYVGNLSYAANDQSVAETFAQCGTVSTSKVIMDRETGRSKGFAFVEMTTELEAQNAISQLNGSSQDGRSIVVTEAKPQAPREDRSSRW